MSSTVLIVDDDFYNRLVLKEFMKGLDVFVIEAENGEKAIQIYEDKYQEIDLVLLDYKMPLLNGYETLLQLKKINNNIKSILITGNFLCLMNIDELNSFNSVLEKPIIFEVLRKELLKYGIK